MTSQVRILRLNKSGLPRAWVSREDAATLYAKDQVLWSLGSESFRLNGGYNHIGERSHLMLAPIIACTGKSGKNSFTGRRGSNGSLTSISRFVAIVVQR